VVQRIADLLPGMVNPQNPNEVEVSRPSDALEAKKPTVRFVFTGQDGGLHRRSNFRRRVWLPAVRGDATLGGRRSSRTCTSTTCATPTRPG
jgi:hypothetical protein